MQHTTYKATNHLGSQAEKLAKAGHSLPPSLTTQLQTLQNATTELKSVLVECLPNEILHNLWVVTINNNTLTIAVSSTTAANHLTYLKQQLITIIKEQSASFTELKDLKITVAHLPQ